MRFKIPANKYHNKLKIQKFKGNYTKGVKDLFSIILILKEMLSKEEFDKFYKILIKNLENLKKKIKLNNYKKILQSMGFPKNYKKIINL